MQPTGQRAEAEPEHHDRHSAVAAPSDGVLHLGYQPALDGLRAVAIGLVLLQHTGLALFDGGSNGVIVFFVLSGFLITKLMIEEWDRTGGVAVGSFYVRRTIRIMPAPLVMIVAMFLLRGFYTPEGPVRDYFVVELLLAAFYVTNLRPLFGGVPADAGTLYLAHTWSLAVEEHFYLVWPWVLRRLRLPERPVVNVVKGLVALAVAITVGRALLTALAPDLVAFSLFSFDGFALGAALAFAIHNGAARTVLRLLAQPVALWLGVVVLVVDLLVGRWSHEVAYAYVTYVGLASVALIGNLVLRQETLGHRLLALPPVVYVGKLSYSLYLWHVPIQAYVSTDRFPNWPEWQIVAVEVPLTIAVAMLSYHIVELPLVGLRRRFSRISPDR